MLKMNLTGPQDTLPLLSTTAPIGDHTKALVSLSCNYDAHPRFKSEAANPRLPFEVETDLKLIEIKDNNNTPRGWTPVFEGEHFIQTITGGGSGASIALLRNTHDQLIIRKLQFGADHCEAARAQNLESIGQAMLAGKEPPISLKPKVQAIIREKSEQIDQFVKQTRPEITKRFVILHERPNQANKYFGSGYDQTAFADLKAHTEGSKSTQTTAPEFAKEIQNHNQPLTDNRLQQLVQAQLDLSHLFQTAQGEIHLAPLSPEEGKQVFHDTYLAKFEKRLGTGFEESQLASQCDQSLLLDRGGDRGDTNLKVHLSALLLAPTVTVNGQKCVNPLAYAHEIKESFSSNREGFLLHGDPQQTNAILVEDEHTRSLRCIDNRGADVQDYLADLTKFLWGPKFIPVMEDMLNIKCDLAPEGFSINTTAKADVIHAVNNLSLFGQTFHEEIYNTETHQDYLKDNPEAGSQLLFTGGIQYLRDLGFVLPRLKSAMASGNTEAALKMSRRIMGDFAGAAIEMTEHKAQFGKSTDPEQPLYTITDWPVEEAKRSEA